LEDAIRDRALGIPRAVFGAFLREIAGRPQPQYGLEVPLFQDIGSGVWVNVAVWVIVSAFFAALVAALPTRSGPVRLFLAGLFLPALTVNVVRLTSGSWPGP